MTYIGIFHKAITEQTYKISNMHSSIIHSKFNIEASNHIYYNSFINDTCIVQRYKRNRERDKEHSIYASFRQVNEICKMKNKKVRTRRVEQEEE